MLVLKQKRHEQIRIGDNIVLKLVRSKDGQQRLGIEAPDEVPIVRELIEDERKAA